MLRLVCGDWGKEMRKISENKGNINFESFIRTLQKVCYNN